MKLWPLLWLSCTAAAEPVTVQLLDMPLPEVAKFVNAQVAKRSVIYDAEFLADAKIVSVDLKGLEVGRVVGAVDELVRSYGYDVEEKAGIVKVGRRVEAQRREWVYQPRFRSVSYLQDAAAPLFPSGTFSGQRAVPQSIGQNPKGVQQKPAEDVKDSGMSAFSLVEKSADVLVANVSDRDRDRLERFLAQVDRAAAEVLVKAVVFEVQTDSADNGAFSLAASILGGRLGLTVGKTVTGDYGAVLKAGGITAVAEALSSDRRFKVVSSPTLRVQSGSSARLLVGTETPVVGQAQVDRNGNPVQSVEYRPSGVIFDIAPQIREEVSELKISQQISNFIATSTGVNNSPTLIKRELQTQVGVRGDEVLVLGGLDEDKSTKESSGLSWLPFFKARTDSASKSEILLILQATRI